MQNIRDHVREYAQETGLTLRTVQNGQAGALFLDEKQFIPFADLGYNRKLGFYQISQFPDVQNEADSGNDWTVHPVESSDGWQAYALLDDDGFGFLLGEDWQAADALAALQAAVVGGKFAEPIPEDAEELGHKWLSISEAALAAHDYDPDEYPLDDNLQPRIRQAARRGTLGGAAQDPTGRWKFQARRFRHWLVNDAAHQRGPIAGVAEP